MYLDTMLPTDLMPLPTAPYSARPPEIPLDIEECRTAIWIARGSVTKAAELLKISSSRLRRFIDKSPYLSAELRESSEQLLDKAVEQIADALEDVEDKARADSAAKFIIQQLGHRRDFGGKGGGKVVLNGKSGDTVTISWDDGSEVTDIPVDPNAKVIDHDE